VRLLVSVRSAAEARLAQAGGAGIIDAKEPDRGPLGQVDAAVLAEIRAAVPVRTWISAALGDVATSGAIARALADVTVPVRFVKLGFRGIQDAGAVEGLLREAVRRAEGHEGRPRIVAVAYGDHARAESLSPGVVCEVARAAGAGGLLIDTCVKDARSLFEFMAVPALAGIGRALAADELEFALAGHLGTEGVAMALDAGATIFGVRGAACDAHRRTGGIVEARVRELAESIRHELPRA